jgi:hypothetical protein
MPAVKGSKTIIAPIRTKTTAARTDRVGTVSMKAESESRIISRAKNNVLWPSLHKKSTYFQAK